MKRLFTLLLTLSLLLGCFTGCTADPTDSSTGATESTGAKDETSNLTVNPNGLALEENGIVYESLAQKAVVKTALAYLARGTRIQYADSRFNPNSAQPITYRWQVGTRLSPEEYTSQYTGYLNCAAFTYDVYLAALDYRIGAYTAKDLTSKSGKERIYRYWPNGKETPEEMAAVEAEFRSNLKIGDIIAIRYNGNKSGSGHAMLYVGTEVLKGVDGYRGVAVEGTDPTKADENDTIPYDIIHSTGSLYNYTDKKEKYEKYGTVQMMSVDSLFDSSTGRYVFSKLECIAIIRPLAVFNKEVPEDTQNRMLYMDNIVAEKLSSHTAGMTVNPGDEMTFTFSITNKNETDVTLAVKDVLPEYLSYVSSENCTVDGQNLSWIVKIPAKQTANVTYTAKVSESMQPGQCVESAGGTVGGIPVICPKVFVGRTLTQEEQQILLDAVKNLNTTQRGMELANTLFNKIPGMENLLADSSETIQNNIFTPIGDYLRLTMESGYIDMVIPGMFGGRSVVQRNATLDMKDILDRYENIRTRLPYADQLMVGDILVATVSVKTNEQKLYMYTGETMLDLLSGDTLSFEDSNACLEKTLAYHHFAILRPSLMLDSKN